jgi:hypothetical protein
MEKKPAPAIPIKEGVAIAAAVHPAVWKTNLPADVEAWTVFVWEG